MMNTSILLSRDIFRESVFKRDNHICVFCKKPAVDAHHIIERRLFADGGYYLNNGASVCKEHHLLCEMTEISVEQVREACGITKVVLPEHFYADQIYDKWGNIILEDGRRLKGELFFDESVQKILKNKLNLFTHLVKYPRTMHLEWSQNVNDDDKVIQSLEHFIDQEVIVTIKMDGENSSVYRDYFHARSIDSRNHPSRNWIKGNIWSQICGDIPEGWRICGENLYATHSIHYEDLPSYFMAFSIWNDKNYRLDWNEFEQWTDLLGIERVPVLYRGIWNEEKIRTLWNDKQWNNMEGYVVTTTKGFPYGEFQHKVAKFVRKNHVFTTKHWMHGQPIIPNKLKDK